jgi:hypothetical protein
MRKLLPKKVTSVSEIVSYRADASVVSCRISVREDLTMEGRLKRRCGPEKPEDSGIIGLDGLSG